MPLGDTEKIMVSSEYVRHLIEVANEKMEANRKRTDSFLDALLKNGFSGGGRVLEHGTANGELGCDEDSGCYNSGKVESLGNSVSYHEDNSMDGEKRSGLDDSQSGNYFFNSIENSLLSVKSVEFVILSTISNFL